MYETEIAQLEADIVNIQSLLATKQLELSQLNAQISDLEILYKGAKEFSDSSGWRSSGFYAIARKTEGSSFAISTPDGKESVELVKLEEEIDYDSYGSVDSSNIYMILKFRNNLYKVSTDADSYGTNWDEVTMNDIKPVKAVEKTVTFYSYE